jgi:peroxiredoxin
MKNYFLFLLLSLLLLSGKAIAQESISIGGSYSDTVLPRAILVKLYRDYFRNNTQVDTAFNLENGSWELRLPKLEGPAWLILSYAARHPFYNWKTRAFLVLPGDSVWFTASNNNHVFAGTGSERYNARDSIEALSYPVTGGMPPDRDSLAYLLRREKLIDSIFAVKKQRFDGSKDRFPPTVEEIYRIDMESEKLADMIGQLRNYLGKKDTIDRAKVITIFNKRFQPPQLDASTGAKIRSAKYGLYLYEYAMMRLYCNNLRKPKFTEICRFIADQYKGIDREKAILYCFSEAIAFGAVDSLSYWLRAAQDWVSYPIWQDLLASYTSAALKGSPAYKFRLENAKGGHTSLTDLKGKVVLVDYWYTGCPGCVWVGKQMPALIDSLKDRRDIVFVSISVDKDKSRWKKSVEDEVYSTKDEINLYTGGMGYKHPLIKFHGIGSYPTIHIIDRKGNILDTAPPKPTTKESMLVLLSRLRLALSQAGN